MLQTHVSPSSPLHLLALSSMAESIAWIIGFTNSIDETYTQYSGGKLGVKKSWRVTTKISRTVGEPRRGAMSSFQAGDVEYISTTISRSIKFS